jgi:hypothetical protein
LNQFGEGYIEECKMITCGGIWCDTIVFVIFGDEACGGG